MKMHFRRISRQSNKSWHPRYGFQFRVACGTDARWTSDTTSDKSKVTCKRCLKFIEKSKP